MPPKVLRSVRSLVVRIFSALTTLARSGSEWSQIDLDAAMLHVHRLKSAKPATHPIRRRRTASIAKGFNARSRKRPLVFVSHELAPTRFKDFWRKPFTAVRKRCQISGTRRVGLSQGSRLTREGPWRVEYWQAVRHRVRPRTNSE